MAVPRVVVSEGLTSDSAFGIANVDKRLPDAESDLTQQMTKDPYNVDFMALRERYDEKELKDALMDNIQLLGNRLTFRL